MKKRGFTLVEVITIIAILGVIALIATPIVLNQIEDARRETFKASVRNVFDAVSSYLAHNEDVDDIPVTGIFIPDSDIYKKLNLKNEKFTDGLIYREDNRVITVSCITDGTYYASGSKNELQVAKGSCDPLDETKPHIKLYVSRVTSSSITVLVDSEDKESGIVSYEYYLGEELKATIKDNIYKFTDLEKDKEYDIKVRVVNGNNQEAEDTIKAKTENNGINWKETPEGWARSKTVTINYPSMEENEIYKYKRVGIDKEWILVNENKVDILLEDDTTITAIVERNGKQILSDTRMFAVDREPPEIKPIEGNLDEWTTSKRIVVNAIDEESGLAEKPYSFDGGLTWQKSNVKIYTSIESVIIQVKDKVGNVAQDLIDIDLIDSTIPKAHKITATIGNSSTKYKSGVWTNQDVVLKANPNPSSTQSGYIYKWYEKKDSKYELIKGVNKQKLTKGEDVVATYKVSIATGAGAGPIDSSNTYVVKIDKTPPTTKAPTVSNIKTNSVEVEHNQQDTGSGLDTTTLEYGYSTSKDGTYTWVKEQNVKNQNITGLTNNKTYYIKTRIKDKVGNGYSESDATKFTTKTFTDPEWEYIDNATTWAKSKKLKVTYYGDNVPNPVYFVKSEVGGTTSVALYKCTTASDKNPTKSACTTSVAAGSKISKNTWYMLNGSNTANITVTSNGTLYALTSDGNNYSSQSTAEVNKIDPPPELTLGKPTTTTESITIPFTAEDPESGIRETTCVYGKSKSYEKNGKVDGNNCILSNLTKGTKYYYKVTTTNNSDLSTSKTGSATAGSTGVSLKETAKNPTDTTYAQSKTITATYTITNVTSPVRYVKTSVATTSSVNGYSCGSDTNPGTCSSTATKSFAAGTWYKVTSNPAVTFKANGAITAMIHDGANYVTSQTYNVNKIDTTAPTLTLGTVTTTTTSITIPFTAEDPESGIRETTCVYGKSKSYEKNGKVDGNNCILSNLTKGTKYYYKVTTTNNSDLSTSKTGSATTGTTGVSLKETAKYPTDTTYAQSKAVTVKYTTKNVTKPVWYVKTSVATTSSVNGYACGKKTDPGTCDSTLTNSFEKDSWYKVESDPVVTFTSNGMIYGMIYDGENFLTAETKNVNKIDPTHPSLTLSKPTTTTKSITIPFTASDAESGISKTTCVYGKNKKYGKTGTVDDNKCKLSNLTKGTTYYYKVTTTNNSGLTTNKTGWATAGSTGVKFSIKQTPKDTDWATSKAVKVTYTATNVTSPVRYVKTDVATTSSVYGYDCGKKTDPGKCDSKATKNFKKDYWYKVKSDPVVTFTSNGMIYGMIYDGEIYSTSETLEVNKIDPSTPTVTITAVKVKKTGDKTTATEVNVSSGAWVKTGTVDNPHGVKMTANTSTSASGYTYKWQRYNEKTGEWESFKRDEDTFTTTSEQKNKQYKVYVTNNAGTTAVSKPFVVNIDNCKNTTTTPGDYSTCNPACGDGTKTRTVTKKGISGRTCSTSKETETCNNGACKCKWYMSIDESNSNFLSYGLKFTGDTTTGSCALKTVERVKTTCYDLNPNGGKTEVGCNTKYFDFRDTKPIYLKSVGAWYDYVEIGEDVMWGDAAQMTVKYKATYNNGNTSAVTYYFFAYGITTEYWGKKLENKEITIDEVEYWYVYYDW